MKKKNEGRLTITLLALLSLGLIAWIAATTWERSRIHTVIIAAGSPRGESFVLMRALKEVVERNYPTLRVVVQESSGFESSVSRLAHGDVQLAAVPTVAHAGPIATVVAVLFQDNAQILVKKTANIHDFGDLKGKRIALPRTGAQWDSFLFIAGQFGLHESDFTFVGADEETASMAFAGDGADAMFRMSALPNESVRRFGATGLVDFLAIERSAGLHAIQPAYMPSTIPQGTYGGNPVMPAADVHTVSMERVLLARLDAGDEAIRAITEVLMTRRQELAAAIPEGDALVRPLFFQTKQPDAGTGTAAQIHPGAQEFYNHTRESFVGGHSDLIAFILAAAAMVWLWITVLQYSTGLAQKIRINDYLNTVVALISEARSSPSDRELEPIQAELLTILSAAIRDLGNRKISDDSFRTFHQIWEIAFAVCDKPGIGKIPFAPPVTPKESEGPLRRFAKSMRAG